MINVICSGTEHQREIWLTVSAAAQAIGFGRRTIERAIKLGALPYRIHDRRALVEQVSILTFRAKLVQLALDEGLAIRKEDGRAVA